MHRLKSRSEDDYAKRVISRFFTERSIEATRRGKTDTVSSSTKQLAASSRHPCVRDLSKDVLREVVSQPKPPAIIPLRTKQAIESPLEYTSTFQPQRALETATPPAECADVAAGSSRKHVHNSTLTKDPNAFVISAPLSKNQKKKLRKLSRVKRLRQEGIPIKRPRSKRRKRKRVEPSLSSSAVGSTQSSVSEHDRYGTLATSQTSLTMRAHLKDFEKADLPLLQQVKEFYINLCQRLQEHCQELNSGSLSQVKDVHSKILSLFHSIETEELSSQVLNSLAAIRDHLLSQNYDEAQTTYFELTIGKSLWPSREDSIIIHHSNSRIHLQAIKRLMTFWQRIVCPKVPGEKIEVCATDAVHAIPLLNPPEQRTLSSRFVRSGTSHHQDTEI